MQTNGPAPEFTAWPLSDGYLLNGRIWSDPQSPRSVAVVYLHGIQSHGGWFEWSAGLLAQQGLPVLLPDRRGSGLNDADRGDVCAAHRWRCDLDELFDFARRTLGVQQLALVGVSWGAKLAVEWALLHPEQTAGVLLIAPGIFPRVGLPLATRLAITAAAAGISPRRPFPIPLDDPQLFTDNPAGQEFIRADPLKLTQVTARFYWHSALLDRWLRRLRAGALQAPLTLALMARDRIINNASTLAWARRIAGNGLALQTLADEVHTPEFTQDRTAFAELLLAWSASLTPKPLTEMPASAVTPTQAGVRSCRESGFPTARE